MSSTYSITVTGIKAGVARETAIKQLSELLKVSEEKVVSMLNSQKFVVMSGVDLAIAANYEAALQTCGGDVVVEPEHDVSDLVFDISEAKKQEYASLGETQFASHKVQSSRPFEQADLTAKLTGKNAKIAASVLVLGVLFFAIVKPTQSVVGSWSCRSFNPAQTVTQETIEFTDDGHFVSNGGSTTLRGVYTKTGKDITLTVTNVSQGGRSLSTNAVVDVTVTKLSSDALHYISVVKRSGRERTHECSRY